MVSRIRPILLMTIFVVSLDHVTKYWAWLTLRGEPTRRLFNDTIRLSFHENPGAFLSMGANLPEIWRTILFVGLTSLFLIYLLYFVLTEDGLSLIGVLFGSAMFAGGLGNLIDRIFFENGVIDFLNVGVGGFRTGIFNIADMAIMVGVFGLLFFGRAAGTEPVDSRDEGIGAESVDLEEEIDYEGEVESAD